jgi:hypothetical protein
MDNNINNAQELENALRQQESKYKSHTEAAMQILKQYSTEMGSLIRSSMDLSPLELWLLMKLVKVEKELIINFLDWYYTESAKTPMRFETDHEDIAMMYLQERSK